jgi:uncharacterized protein YuzE
MQIKYFQDTDTLMINFNDSQIQETKEINENVLVELDGNGNIVSITLEHAKSIANINDLNYQQVVGT